MMSDTICIAGVSLSETRGKRKTYVMIRISLELNVLHLFQMGPERTVWERGFKDWFR